MLRKLYTLLLVLTVLTTAAFAQDMKNVQTPKVAITGAELGNPGASSIVAKSVKFEPVVTSELTFNFVNSSVFTGYDLQSNGTPQHIWQDPNDPNLVYMVFTTSSETAGWSERNGTYLFSDDMGANWQNLGVIQTSTAAVKGGFVTLSGLTNGRPVAALHTNDEGTPTRTHVYVRDAAGSAWTNYNPGPTADGEGIWPRVLGVGSDRVILTSSVNPAPNPTFFTNVLDLTTGNFLGWQPIIGDQAEAQNMAQAANGTIGLAYIGNGVDSITNGDVFYRESNDNGASWSDPVTVYEMDWTDSLGAMRGIDITFLEDEPYVVFEVIKQDFGAGTYFGSYPNKIYIWSPTMGAKVIADSNNIPYFDNYEGSNDVFAPVCRPSIGKTADNSALFVTISATSPDTMMVEPPGTDANNFFRGYFMYSTDDGATFTAPERFTPATPLRDWRYISINPINERDPVTGTATVLMSAQADEIPGSTVNVPPAFPLGVTAEMVFIYTEVEISSVNDDPQVSSYNLEQNYPNPFNPSTSINFSVPQRSDVTLKVYDVLGKEVATLINETKEAGSYNATFNSSNLASGMYLYTLKAGSFTSTKKMILMK